MQPFLSKQNKEIILGSLSGDGSLRINKPYKSARFSFRHSIVQKEYFFWKTKKLAEISGNSCFWIQKPDGWSRKEKLRYQSLALRFLTEIYNLTNKKNQLFVSREWLDMLTPLSLCVWWLDDGSIVSNGRKGVLCTYGVGHEDNKVLSEYLKERWGVRTGIGKAREKIGKMQKEYYRLCFYSTEELKKFLRIILPYFPVESILSKIIILYKDSLLQQRWISEVSQLTKFPRQVIENCLTEKKKKWKNFRE